MKKKDKLWQLFKSTLYLSAFTFGGGYVILTLMKDTFVDKLKWIDKDQMLDMAAIAQSAPGAVAINSSVVVGYEIGGFWGILVAIIGTSLPPLIIISTISLFYEAFIANKYIATFLRGMQAAIAALILKVVIDMAKDILKTKSVGLIIVMVLSFILAYIFDVSIIFIILGLIGFGIFYSLIRSKKDAD